VMIDKDVTRMADKRSDDQGTCAGMTTYHNYGNSPGPDGAKP